MSEKAAADFLKSVHSLDDVFIRAGAAAGHSFTTEELQRVVASSELSDKELEQVAGGRNKHQVVRQVIKSVLGVQKIGDNCGPGIL